MKLVTLFLKTENVHLQKDVGMIPFLLHKYYGYDSGIVTYRNGADYPYARNEVKGLGLWFLKKRLGIIADGCFYLMRNAKRIDILNVYHLNLSSFFYLFTYRIFRKRGSIAYLKLDMNPVGLKNAFLRGPVGWIKRRTMAFADVMSVESTLLLRELKKHYGDKVFYLPNGYSLPERKVTVKKEDVILTVGNLGTREKATDVLLEAFADCADRQGFTLRLVGSVTEEFRAYQEACFEKYPALRERVVFCGSIQDKNLLAAEYDKAKIFAFPSRSESFGIVLTEASSRGDYIITTEGVPAGYDISCQGKYGMVIGIDDRKALSEAFVKLWNMPLDWEGQAEEIRHYTEEHFQWEKLCAVLQSALAAECGERKND